MKFRINKAVNKGSDFYINPVCIIYSKIVKILPLMTKYRSITYRLLAYHDNICNLNSAVQRLVYLVAH